MSMLETAGWFAIGYLRYLAWGVPIGALVGVGYGLVLRLREWRRMPCARVIDSAERTWRRYE